MGARQSNDYLPLAHLYSPCRPAGRRLGLLHPHRLVSLDSGSSATYQYDGLHRRIKRTEGSTTTHYYYNNNWQCVEERLSETGNPTKQYLWHPEYIDALAVSYTDLNADGSLTGTGEGTHYYLHDANYNVTGVLNSSGAVVERYHYSPYGEVTILHGENDSDGSVNEWDVDSESDIGNEFLYTGRRLDPETGLQQSRYRYYHAQLGRFINRDPIGYDGSEYNLYEYVGGMPTGFVDPNGLRQYKCHCSTYDYLPGLGAHFTKKDIIINAANDQMARQECKIRCGGGNDFNYGIARSETTATLDERYTDGIKLCKRTVLPGTKCACAMNSCGGEHTYIQFGPVQISNGIPKGYEGIINGDENTPYPPTDAGGDYYFPGVGWANQKTPEYEQCFNPSSCEDYIATSSKPLPGTNIPANKATEAQLINCLKSHMPTSTYNIITYNCASWAKEALEACGLTKKPKQ